VLSPGVSPPKNHLRVALISEHASPLATVGDVDAGGQNVHVAALAAGLTRLGHDVVVYTRRDDAALPVTVTTPAGYAVVHLAAGPPESLPKDDLWPHMGEFADALAECFALNPPDVVHAHFWMSGWAARRALATTPSGPAPLFVTFHALGVVKRRHQGSADTSPADRDQVELGLAREADRIIATCRDEVQELTALGADASRISVVPCGVDLDLFTPAPDPGSHPEREDERPFRVLSVGRLVPRKGFGDAIEAIAAVPDAELLIAGGPEQARMEGHPEVTRLLGVASRHGVSDRVRLLGPVPRRSMPVLLRSVDVVVCAPWYEPFGIVPLEAMACGVPVVATAVGGLLDTVVDQVTGLHVPPRDPAALSAALNHLRAHPEQRRAYGEAAAARVGQRFSWAQVSTRTAALYRAGVQANSRPSQRRSNGVTNGVSSNPTTSATNTALA
jgi:D-inositol-3-phosphate glycosyltransferase